MFTTAKSVAISTTNAAKIVDAGANEKSIFWIAVRLVLLRYWVRKGSMLPPHQTHRRGCTQPGAWVVHILTIVAMRLHFYFAALFLGRWRQWELAQLPSAGYRTIQLLIVIRTPSICCSRAHAKTDLEFASSLELSERSKIIREFLSVFSRHPLSLLRHRPQSRRL